MGWENTNLLGRSKPVYWNKLTIFLVEGEIITNKYKKDMIEGRGEKER